MGTMANELTLGCDCLGQIHYLVSTYAPTFMEVTEFPPAWCICEARWYGVRYQERHLYP
jgi:Cu2+-containing amine oxidase